MQPIATPLIVFLILALVAALLTSLRSRRHAILQRARANVLQMDVDRTRVRIEELERDALDREGWARLLLNRTHDMVLVFGVNADGLPGNIIEVNAQACETLRYTRERLLKMTIFDLEDASPHSAASAYARLHDTDGTVSGLAALENNDTVEPQNVVEMRRHMKRVIEEGAAAFEQVLLRSDGQFLPVEVQARRFEHGGRTHVLLSVTDLTKHRETMQALSDSMRFSRDFLAHSAVGAAIYSGERALANVNRTALRMFGIADQQEFSRVDIFAAYFVPPKVREAMQRGESTRFETMIDFDDVRQHDLFKTTRTGRAHLDVCVNNLGLDHQYASTGYLVQVQDITQRREIELELKQRDTQLRQAQKLQAIGTLAGGIAHDFNNLLTPVLGYTEMALDLASHDETASGYLREVIRASLRAKELSNQILTFSRQVEPEGKPIRLIPIVKEVLNLQQASLPKNITIVRSINTDRDVVVAEPSQIHQVMMNLCTNAAHAMRGRAGTLEVRVADTEIGPRQRGQFANMAPGRYLHIAVRDSGTGIPAEVVDRIFEPFFTTKERGEGTGMGLAVVHGIVSSLNGLITVRTRINIGTTFDVYLPAVDVGTEQTPVSTEEIPRGDECILFVDDEVDIVRMLSRMLASLGYRPVVTHRSGEALKLFQADPDRYDLLIADQVMPEMSGLDLARQVYGIKKGQPVIICSGFIDTLPVEQARAFGVREILRKPVSKRELAVAIRNALDA
ncbi:MAG: ATP-binding protein [Verrucomicrobia bacterium]|nr:ATP-binding protein [Verrucomicrobiota bacterium]